MCCPRILDVYEFLLQHSLQTQMLRNAENHTTFVGSAVEPQIKRCLSNKPLNLSSAGAVAEEAIDLG